MLGLVSNDLRLLLLPQSWGIDGLMRPAPLQCCGYNKPMIRVIWEPQSPPWVTKPYQPSHMYGMGANLPYFS